MDMFPFLSSPKVRLPIVKLPGSEHPLLHSLVQDLDHLDFNSSRGRELLRPHHHDHDHGHSNSPSGSNPEPRALISSQRSEGIRDIGTQSTHSAPNATPSTSAIRTSAISRPTYSTPNATPSTSIMSGLHGDRSTGNQPGYYTPNTTPSTSAIGDPRNDRGTGGRPAYSTPNATPSPSAIGGPHGERGTGNQPVYSTPNATPSPSAIAGSHGERSTGSRAVYSTFNAAASTISGPRGDKAEENGNYSTPNATPSAVTASRRAPSTSRSQSRTRSVSFSLDSEGMAAPQDQYAARLTGILRGARPRSPQNLPASMISPDTASFRRQQASASTADSGWRRQSSNPFIDVIDVDADVDALDNSGEGHEAPQPETIESDESDDAEVDELAEDDDHTSATLHPPDSHRNDGQTAASGSSPGSPTSSSRQTSSHSRPFAPPFAPQASHQETALHARAEDSISSTTERSGRQRSSSSTLVGSSRPDSSRQRRPFRQASIETPAPTISTGQAPTSLTLFRPVNPSVLRILPGLYNAFGVAQVSPSNATTMNVMNDANGQPLYHRFSRKFQSKKLEPGDNCTVWTITDGPFQMDSGAVRNLVQDAKIAEIHFHRNQLTDEINIWLKTGDWQWENITRRWAITTTDPVLHPKYPDLVLDTQKENEWAPMYMRRETYANRQHALGGLRGFTGA